MANNITKAAAVIVVMNLVAKILGFVREMAIAGAFGATMYTDAYLVAYTLPYSLQAVLGSALVTVTVPLLTKYLLEDNQKEANLVGNYFLNLVALAMLVITILGIAFAPILVTVTAPSLDNETAALAVQLTRIMFPSILFMSIGMVLSGYLNANHRFLVSASAPALCSAIIIVSVLFCNTNPRFGSRNAFGLYRPDVNSFPPVLPKQVSVIVSSYLGIILMCVWQWFP